MIRNKRGFITVEASIFFPLFFIGILTLSYLMKVMWIQEDVFFGFVQESKEVAKRSYVTEIFSEKNHALKNSYPFFIKKKTQELQAKDVEGLKIRDYRYLYRENNLDGLITATLDYDIRIKFPIHFYDKINIQDRLLFRAFIGTDGEYDPLSFQAMEEQQDAHTVWVFPRAGERYHQESCSYITNQPKQMLLTRQLRRKYDGCDNCKASTLTNGSLVYCFTKTGTVFHRGSCPSVERYVIAMERNKAEKKGYTPCMKCKGGT